MKKLLNGFIKRIDALLVVAGIALITSGVWMYSVPAAMITGGVLLLIDVHLPRLRNKK